MCECKSNVETLVRIQALLTHTRARTHTHSVCLSLSLSLSLSLCLAWLKATLLARGFTAAEIPRLVQTGVIGVQSGEDQLYKLSLPNAGPFVRELLVGRKQLLTCVRRKKFKEALKRDLQKQKLSSTRLPVTYHVLDVLGLSGVTVAATTRGPLVRLKRSTAATAVTAASRS